MDTLNERKDRPKYVLGPLGDLMTLADLPTPDTKHWTVLRKAKVVAAVKGELLTVEEACKRYAMSSGELAMWREHIDRYGIAGLRTTRTQQYR